MLIVGLCIANIIMYNRYDSVDTTKYPVKEYFIRFKSALLALLMPVIILGGIYSGKFTLTESAAVACVYALIVSCLHSAGHSHPPAHGDCDWCEPCGPGPDIILKTSIGAVSKRIIPYLLLEVCHHLLGSQGEPPVHHGLRRGEWQSVSGQGADQRGEQVIPAMKKCIIISDSFKGFISSLEICEMAKQSIGTLFPACQVVPVPVADGGEGTVDCFIRAIQAQPVHCDVTGPYGEPVQVVYCRKGAKADFLTAVLHRVADQLAHAIGGSLFRVEPVAHHGQAGRGSYLDNGERPTSSVRRRGRTRPWSNGWTVR